MLEICGKSSIYRLSEKRKRAKGKGRNDEGEEIDTSSESCSDGTDSTGDTDDSENTDDSDEGPAPNHVSGIDFIQPNDNNGKT